MALQRKAKLGLCALAAAGVAGLAALWSYREPIAQDALDTYFAERGVEASYEIKAIETRRQRLEHVRIGPKSAPDLTADWLEIDVGPSLSGVSIKAVRAGGVRLRARHDGEKFSFGMVDRLLPAPSTAPFRLPDVDVSLEDARARVESPSGVAGVRLDGQGNLRAGFEGKLALVAPRLAMADCTVRGATLYGDLSVVGARPTFLGPLRFQGLTCPDLAVRPGAIALDANMAEDGSDWRGSAHLAAIGMDSAGWRLNGPRLKLDIKGTAKQTEARFRADLNRLDRGGMGVADAVITGTARLAPERMDITGRATAQRLIAGGPAGASITQLKALRTTALVGPVAAQLADALTQMAQATSGRADFALRRTGGQTQIAVNSMTLDSRSGARLIWSGKPALAMTPAGLVMNGRLRFGGGGLPAGTGEMMGRSGVLRLAPYRVRGGQVQLDPVRFWITPQGLGVVSRARLDGPVGSGRMTGLTVPLRIMPGQNRPNGCFPVTFRSLVLDGLRLGATSLRSCIDGRSARLIAPRLHGRLGQDAVQIAASRAVVRMADGRADVTNLSLRMRGADGASDLALARLQARPARGGWHGTADGLAGFVAAVPIGLSAGQGDWSFAKGALRWQGTALMADRSGQARFNDMRLDHLEARLAKNMVRADAVVREPRSGAEISRLTLEHDLATARGQALLDVAQLRFGADLQPEALTPVTLGVVANVYGDLRGQGRINWGPDGVTSSGAFETDGLDYAAAFGPVTGMKGAINFTDLLALVTAPEQRITIAAINPGVLVANGDVRYRILPGYKVQVEGGRWPFAGGVLSLEPTVLDMSEAAERRLTFKVEGLDAARFIEAMAFENIAATGVYDGVLPMVFDASGGRIEGGRLVARGSGTVSYVGQVSNENLGLMGRFAFDALKSMRYHRLAIDLNGAIDGDVITRISFAGVNQAPVAGGRTKLPIKVLGVSNMPFVFNVTITAKFRQLFDMARSFNDPSILINRLMPQLEPEAVVPPKPVQPGDSDPRP